MPKVPPTIHPCIQKAVDETMREAFNPALLSTGDEGRRALGQFQSLRNKRIWPMLLSGLVALFLFIGMGASFDDGLMTAGWILAAALVSTIAFMFVQGRRLAMTNEELVHLAPALRLTRIQRAYLDARTVLESLALPAEMESELTGQLTQLVDEEARLLAMKEQGNVRATPPEAIEAELEALRERLAAATDPASRDALEHGLRTCERRLASAQGLSLVIQRIDAQLEMIAQSIGDVRDGLHRMRMAPESSATSVEMVSIRETLEHVQNHAAAIEKAVAEVQAIEGRSIG
ncbi:hypothetical protein EON82_19175 [bacterium]|nr:MAG: hypothetical protein EON82_19175 [bacterium]